MSPSTRNWQRADKQALWHPFTQMRDWLACDPLVIERAEGFELIDTDGKRYIDGHASLWVNVHGHGHSAIVEAIARQAATLDHSTLLGLASTRSIELARRLIDLAPDSLSRVFYSDAGSTAVEIAVKMSFQYWQQAGQKQRTQFVCFDGAYHGDTVGSVSVGGIDLFHQIFQQLLFHTLRNPYPYAYRDQEFPDDEQACTDRDLRVLEKTLAQRGHEICAVITEPGIQGAAGMITAAPGYLKRVEALCRQYNVHLIVDEVATGFGRTGRMFACEHEAVQPDFMCLAKGLTGGVLPLAATLASETIFEGFLASYEDYKTFFHGHSFTGNPIACAAAIASLDLFDQQQIVAGMPARIDQYQQLLHAAFADHPNVGEIRRSGWMTGMELVTDRDSRNIWPASEQIPQKIAEAARQRGAVIRPLGNVMVLMPAPTMDPATLERLVQITRQSIADVLEKKV